MTTMHRRDFLQGIAATAAGWDSLSRSLGASAATSLPAAQKVVRKGAVAVSLDGYSQVASFKTEADSWTVREDLRSREGSLVFESSSGARRMLARTAEASMPEGIPYLGLALKEIGLSSPDLLADRLLQNGDPDPEKVKSAAPPMASAEKNPRTWTTFVGTREAYDVTPVYRSGNTRTYHPIQYSPELREALKKGQVYDGLVGGWMPAVRKVIPISDHTYWEVIVFGDVGPNKNKYIVHTWHRTALIEDGKIAKVVYGHSYPAYPPGREDPQPKEFYRALLAFAEYWDEQLHDFTPASLPQSVWIDMSKHSFAKELVTRPGGVYPKYGAVDRDYAGSEYDGFQDIFTSAIYTNMEWGRFETAHLFIDNYFTEYVDSKGMIDMRGPETAQFGMTLSLLARYFNYTRDRALIVKHRGKIEATAKLLGDMHDESLQLPRENPAYGLIRGWSESDSCLTENPSLYWQPYYANSAFAARGFKDIARLDGLGAHRLFARHGEASARLAGARPDAPGADRGKHPEKLSDRQGPILHRIVSRYYANVSRVTGKGKAEPAAMAAPSVRRTAAGGCAAATPGQPSGRLHARLRRHHPRRRSQRVAFSGRRPRDSGLHLVWVCTGAAAIGPHRRIFTVPLLSSLSCPYAGKLDSWRGNRHHGRFCNLLRARATDRAAACALDARARGFGRGQGVPRKGSAAPVGGLGTGYWN
jgi:hypothetical protein